MNTNTNTTTYDRNRYTVSICKCGHIHFIENSKIDAAIENGCCLMTVCRHCGEIFIIGADYQPEWTFCNEVIPAHYDMWSEVVQQGNDVIFAEFKYNEVPIHEIIFSMGKCVKLKNGKKANHFSNLGDVFWSDEMPGRLRSDLEAFINEDPTTLGERLLKFYDDSNGDVDMEYLFKEYSEEELMNLSKYAYRCFDWTGTPYEI